MACKKCKYFNDSEMVRRMHDLNDGYGLCVYSIPAKHIPSSWGGIITGISADRLGKNPYIQRNEGSDCPVFKPIKSILNQALDADTKSSSNL